MKKMMTSVAQTVGVDISKNQLDVCLYPCAAAHSFANTDAGITAFLAWLNSHLIHRPINRIVFEPTGAYHRRLERRLAKAERPMVKVNPLQARRFAEAIGKRYKTDAVDAAMLARFGALEELQTRTPPSQTLDEMKQLLAARRALVKDRVAAINRDRTHAQPLLIRLTAQRLRQIERQIGAIDDALRALCRVDPALQGRLDILVSIPGIGEATALTMLIEMPELGTLENKEAASLAGLAAIGLAAISLAAISLAPVARDSGQHSGKRFIRGGRAHLRQALYMPALVAIRFNPDMKAKYQAFIAAIMRKLTILANALLRGGRTWQDNQSAQSAS